MSLSSTDDEDIETAKTHTLQMSRRRIRRLVIAGLVLVVVAVFYRAIGPQLVIPVSADIVAPGVLHRVFYTGGGARIDIIDDDLLVSNFRPDVVVDDIVIDGFADAGKPHNSADWLKRTDAIACSNGGFFGDPLDDGRIPYVGLIMRKGNVSSGSRPKDNPRDDDDSPHTHAYSTLGIAADGTPRVAWTTTPRTFIPPPPNGCGQLTVWSSPVIADATSTVWNVPTAVGCGPTLIHNSHVWISDRVEHHVMDSPYARTFVAYDIVGSSVGHFVMGTSTASYFPDLARFLMNYFPRYDQSHVDAAMCLDGGNSSQLSYRSGQRIASPLESGTLVPDALVLIRR